jgi:Arc/MetJ-type ribon-helix-helix transcriptional regulator
MKIVTISLPDDQAEALDRAVADGGFTSPTELVVAAIEDFRTAPIDYDPDALARDIAEHMAAKSRGDIGLSPEAARAWLRAARST